MTNDEQPAPAASKQVTTWQRWFAWADHWSRNTWMGVVALVLGFALHTMYKARYDTSKRCDERMMLALFVLAIALRVFFGPFGPHHVNGQGPLWIMGATSDPTRLSGYGPGYFEVFSFVCEAFPGRPDTAIFIANMLLGSLAAPLLFVLARKMGLDLARAAIAAAMLAIDAVAIRYSATEAYFPVIITLALGAAVCFVSGATRLQERRRVRCLALTLLGALLSIQAARIHPVAWGPVALGPAFVVAVRIARPNGISAWKQHLRLLVASAAMATLLAFVALVTSGRVFAHVASTVGEHWDVHSAVEILVHRILADPRIAYLLAFVAVYFSKPRNCTVPALLSLAALAATRNAYAQSPIWIASYDRLWLSAPLVMFASMIPRMFLRIRHAWVMVIAMLVVVFVARMPTMTERTTEQLEYAFFRKAFASSPVGCRVVHVPRVNRRIVLLPEYAIDAPTTGPRAIVGVSSVDEVRSLLQSGGCVHYARTSLCTSTDGRSVCEAIETGVHLVPVSVLDLPAKPSHITSTYDRDVVRIGLFEVRRGP